MNNTAKKLNIILSVSLVLSVVLFTFLPALRNNFTNWDDNGYVTKNNIIKTFSWASVKKIFTVFHMDAFQPVTLLSYLFEYHFFGLNPLGYHFTNLILHLLNCVFVFWFIFLLSGRISVSLVTAVLFGIHPLQVESVAWISERKGLLYAFFFLGALISYSYYLKKGRALKYYYLSIFLFLFSLLAKATAVTLPMMLFFVDHFLYRKRDKSMLKDKILFFILSIIFVIVTLFAHYLGGHAGEKVLFNFSSKVMVASYAVIFYLIKIFLPIKLSCLYPHPQATVGISHSIFLLSPFLLGIVLIPIIISGRYTKKVIFGSAVFMVSVFPALQFVEVGKTVVSDRYVYLPLVGILYIVSEGLMWLYQKKNRYSKALKSILPVFLISIIGVLSFLSRERTKAWKDSVSLWTDVLNVRPDVVAYNGRGVAYYDKGDFDRAFSNYNKAIQIDPNYAEVYVSRGVAYYYKGDIKAAVADYDAAIKINPSLIGAFYNRGLAYGNTGNLDQAVSDFTQAIKLKRDHAEAFYNRGLAYYYKGDIKQAIADYDTAIEINPYLAEAYYYRGIAYGNMGSLDLAISDFTKAIQINPNHTDAYINRARAYYYKQEYDKAWEDIGRVESLGYKVDPKLVEGLSRVSKKHR